MELLDTGGNHIYTQMHLTGHTGAAPAIDITLDIQMLDTNGDGFPDFGTLSDLGPLQFFGLDCGGAGTPTKIYVPIAHEPGGKSSIIADIDGNGAPDPDLFFGPVLAVAPVVAVAQIPTLSSLGLAILSLVLLAVGLKLTRQLMG